MILNDADILAKLRAALMNYRVDIAERNNYIYRRDRILYDNGLFDDLDIPDGFDRTLFNPLRRAVDIHALQLMGETFSVYSYYDKQDISSIDPQDKDGLQQAELSNKMRQVKATGRKNAWEAIIRDNGGEAIWKDLARTLSAYGSGLFMQWLDRDAKKVRVQQIESVNNWYPIWADNNFREREGDAYVYQITDTRAYRLYGNKLSEGENFVTTYAGDPLLNYGGDNSSNLASQGNTTSSNQSQQLMCNVIDFTGYLEGIGLDKDGNFIEVDRSKEDKVSFMAVGDKIVKTIKDPASMPRFYYFPNRVVPRRPYGESDIVEEAIQTAQTYIERMSSLITLADKTVFPIIQAKGFSQANMPKRNKRSMQMVPMKIEQELKALNLPAPFGIELQILNELSMNMLAYLGIPKVLFYDPESNPASNAALLTTLRPMLDIVRDKQAHIAPIIVQMATDALQLAGELDPSLKELNDRDDGDWYFYVRWPSALLKDDPTHQAMLINDLRAGTLSLDSYLEKRGVQDVVEEIDRIRDNMKDPVKAAVLGGQLGQLAHFTIYESLGIPLYGFNQPKITLRGDLTPQQEANLAQNQGYNDGPFGASIGPQGREGQAANDNAINQGFLQGNPFDGGLPTGITPGQPINPANPAGQPPAGGSPAPAGATAPALTPQNNNPGTQPMSLPGSGAPSMTPEGANKQHNQRRGR